MYYCYCKRFVNPARWLWRIFCQDNMLNCPSGKYWTKMYYGAILYYLRNSANILMCWRVVPVPHSMNSTIISPLYLCTSSHITHALVGEGQSKSTLKHSLTINGSERLWEGVYGFMASGNKPLHQVQWPSTFISARGIRFSILCAGELFLFLIPWIPPLYGNTAVRSLTVVKDPELQLDRQSGPGCGLLYDSVRAVCPEQQCSFLSHSPSSLKPGNQKTNLRTVFDV